MGRAASFDPPELTEYSFDEISLLPPGGRNAVAARTEPGARGG